MKQLLIIALLLSSLAPHLGAQAEPPRAGLKEEPKEPPRLSTGERIEIPDMGFSIVPPNGWMVNRNSHGSSLLFEAPKQPNQSYMPTIQVMVFSKPRYVDEVTQKEYGDLIVEKFGKLSNRVTGYHLRSSEIVQMETGDPAILYYTEFQYDDVPIMQMHILISSASDHFLMSYTDVAKVFEDDNGSPGLGIAYASMHSAQLMSQPPWRWRGFVIVGVFVFLVLMGWFTMRFMRARKLSRLGQRIEEEDSKEITEDEESQYYSRHTGVSDTNAGDDEWSDGKSSAKKKTGAPKKPESKISHVHSSHFDDDDEPEVSEVVPISTLEKSLHPGRKRREKTVIAEPKPPRQMSEVMPEQPVVPAQPVNPGQQPGQVQYAQQTAQPPHAQPGQQPGQVQYAQQSGQHPGQAQYSQQSAQVTNFPQPGQHPGQHPGQAQYAQRPGQEQYAQHPGQAQFAQPPGQHHSQAQHTQHPGQEQFAQQPAQHPGQAQYAQHPGQEQYAQHPGQAPNFPQPGQHSGQAQYAQHAPAGQPQSAQSPIAQQIEQSQPASDAGYAQHSVPSQTRPQAAPSLIAMPSEQLKHPVPSQPMTPPGQAQPAVPTQQSGQPQVQSQPPQAHSADPRFGGPQHFSQNQNSNAHEAMAHAAQAGLVQSSGHAATQPSQHPVPLSEQPLYTTQSQASGLAPAAQAYAPGPAPVAQTYAPPPQPVSTPTMPQFAPTEAVAEQPITASRQPLSTAKRQSQPRSQEIDEDGPEMTEEARLSEILPKAGTIERSKPKRKGLFWRKKTDDDDRDEEQDDSGEDNQDSWKTEGSKKTAPRKARSEDEDESEAGNQWAVEPTKKSTPSRLVEKDEKDEEEPEESAAWAPEPTKKSELKKDSLLNETQGPRRLVGRPPQGPVTKENNAAVTEDGWNLNQQVASDHDEEDEEEVG